ncbi:MAG TPA: 5'-3' exonuclease H3TH domain-containing protein [Acidimicrobiales bacterium]|nr:5'-3' exonuclease H3TH domain-containing protein [Acidimicrobiales bacterium]
MKAFLVDGTYELFRYYHGAPPHLNASGVEVGATRAVLGSLLGMMEGGTSHLGVATDHVIESWRNELWAGYKSSAGVPADLLSQFGLLEDALRSIGVVVWPMTELEADDALASAAAALSEDPRVEQVLICTPDKDLGQCVQGSRVVCLDRRKMAVVDEAAVRARFGVGPASVPDWLALVGDSADGYPGLAGWGAKTTSTVLGRYGTIEQIPLSGPPWPVGLPRLRADTLRTVLQRDFDRALLFKRLATCVVQRDLLPAGNAALDSLAWAGPGSDFEQVCAFLEAPALLPRAERLASKLSRPQASPPGSPGPHG